ncbi:glycosyltransferase family 4 protein [Geodermatophilus sp. URMC 61]|uniref:glycosyltransferase family 4 protein n=1 Tax=Geodermatophilus sp. URMC 61 TaxID=3423411 RepID=UPI00406C450C
MSDSYPPLIGGATRDTALLSQELVGRGHDVVVATVAQPGLPARSTEAGVPVVRIPALTSRFSDDPHRRHHPPVPDPESVRHLRSLVRDHRPDVVHSYGWLTYSALAAVTGTDVPLALSIRDYSNVCAVRTLMREEPRGQRACAGPAPVKCLRCAQRYYRSRAKSVVSVTGVLASRGPLSRRVTGIHYCSSHVRDVLHEHMSWAGRAAPPVERVIPSFRADGGSGEPDRTVLDALPDRPYLLFVGPLRRIKGIDELLAAYEALEDPPPLVLIGSLTGETPSTLPRGVHLFTDVSHATVMAAWDRALFGVAPSTLAEPLGNVVHEAMSTGRPVIGTAPSGMTEMITHEGTGLLVPPGDVVALRTAMDRLIRDADLRNRLGAAARERAGRFTAATAVPRFEAFYRDVVARGGRGRGTRGPGTTR